MKRPPYPDGLPMLPGNLRCDLPRRFLGNAYTETRQKPHETMGARNALPSMPPVTLRAGDLNLNETRFPKQSLDQTLKTLAGLFAW